MLSEKYPAEVKKILAKYPPERKRSAVMPLLYLAQSQDGYITKDSMAEIAGLLDMTTTEVTSIVGFYTLFHDKREGKYRMQVCTGLPWRIRGADQVPAELCIHLWMGGCVIVQGVLVTSGTGTGVTGS